MYTGTAVAVSMRDVYPLNCSKQGTCAAVRTAGTVCVHAQQFVNYSADWGESLSIYIHHVYKMRQQPCIAWPV